MKKKIFIRILSAFLCFLIVSCTKENIQADKEYTVKYELKATPLSNANLTGNITYISKTTVINSGVISNTGWMITEASWKLKAGDKIGFTASIANLATYEASITVDGAVRVFEKGSSSIPLTTPFNLSYTIE